MASFFKRGKTWSYRIQKKKNGKIILDYQQSGFRSKREAEVHAMQKELDLSKGKTIAKEDIIFADYYADWIKLYKVDGNARTDSFRYASIKKVKTLFGDTPIQNITKKSYQQALNKFAEKRSKATVLKHHRYFKACFENAIDEEIIYINPAKNAVIRGDENLTKNAEDKYLNYNDAKELKDAVLDAHYSTDKIGRNIIIIALETGMRFGEILALTWDRIDFDNKTITIDRAWDYHFLHNFIPTKTKNKRTIAVSNDFIDFLTNIRKNTDSDFAIGSNHPITNNGANYSLAKACKRAGVKTVTLHALRHTHGSILLYKGFSIAYISKRLGHASISITQDVYLHLLDELKQHEDDKIINGFL